MSTYYSKTKNKVKGKIRRDRIFFEHMKKGNLMKSVSNRSYEQDVEIWGYIESIQKTIGKKVGSPSESRKIV